MEVLEYLRERLRAANTKGPLRATELLAPSGIHASAITRLSNHIQKEVLNDKSMRNLSCLEPPKGDREFGLLTSAMPPGLLKYFLNALYVRQVDVLPLHAQLGLEMCYCKVCAPMAMAMPMGPAAGLCSPVYNCTSAWERLF